MIERGNAYIFGVCTSSQENEANVGGPLKILISISFERDQ